MVEHVFLKMECEGYRRWRGHCQCGHIELWTDNKDWAWEEIADHIINAPDGLRSAVKELRAKQARNN